MYVQLSSLFIATQNFTFIAQMVDYLLPSDQA